MKLRPTVWKTIFRATFRPSLGYFAAYTNTAQAIEGYPNWEVDGTRVSLRDWSKRRSVSLEHNSFGFEQDSGDEELESQSIDQLLKIIPSSLGILEFARLGYRRKYLVEVEMSFDSLLAILNTRVLRPELSGVLPRSTDCVYRYDSVGNPYSYFIWLAPVRKSELFRALEFNHEHHLNPKEKGKDWERIHHSHPETALLLDIDFFQKDAKGHEAANFIITTRQQLEKITNDFVGYCFSTEPDLS